ncbi:hypothetical protein EI94DRAFT_289937 [Lactarius quietus]|nr:hypothetical protein EI94DRAFT_289937 [Lactarius quietus]
MADLESALKRLDRLTQEEARMALAEVLKITDNIRDEVRAVDGKVENVEDKVDDIGDKVADVGYKVEDIDDKVEDICDQVEDIGDQVEDIGDRVQCVDEKVQVVINDGRQARLETQEAKLIIQHTANVIDEVKFKTAPTSVDFSRRSIHKPQHRTKGSTQGIGGLVIQRHYYRRMEVYWLPHMGLRKTGIREKCHLFLHR